MVVGFQAELDCSCELGVLLAFMSVVITSFRNHGAREHAEHTDFGCSNALMLTRLEEPADGRRDHGLHEIGWLVKKKTHAVNHLEKRLSAIVVGVKMYQLSLKPYTEYYSELL